VRRFIVPALVLAAGLSRVAPVAADEQAVDATTNQEQRVEAIAPPTEQRIEVISGSVEVDDGSQRVVALDDSREQTVGEHIPPTPGEKQASKAGQFVLGVASAGVALGVMAASLLLL
jgi:hypothetical protein